MYNRYGARRRDFWGIPIIYIFMVLIMIVGFLNDHDYIATVSDKERIVQSNDSFYLIFCNDSDGNYYELRNSDSLFRWKFDSSNIYNRIEVGKTYRFTVVGYRVGFLSMYENIIEFEELKE